MLQKLIRILLLIFISSPLTGPSLAADTKDRYIESATYTLDTEQTLIEIKFSRNTKYQSNQLKNPDRLYFDLEVSDIDKKLTSLVTSINKTKGLITKAVIAKNKPNIVRIVFYLSDQANTRVNGNGRIIKILTSRNEIPDLIDNFYQVESTQPKEGARIVKRYKIAIDPGHGGKDPGAVGRKGTTEKSINLSIAKKLKQYIDEDPTMDAVLTRDKDVYVALIDRIAKIRNPEPTIFISIHADGAKNRKASGSSVFILPHKNAEASSKYAKRLAEKENEMASNSNWKPDDDPAVYEIKSALKQRTTRLLSEQLGTSVLTHISKVNNLHKKRVESANFAVLKSIDVCSILVETAFLSNSVEEKELRTSAYQERLALAIFRGIKDFLENADPKNLGFKLSEQ